MSSSKEADIGRATLKLYQAQCLNQFKSSTQSNSLLALKKLAWRDSNKDYKKIGSNPVCKILQNNGLTQVKNCSDT